MKTFANTKTIDGLMEGAITPAQPIDAELLVLGSRPINLEDFPKLKGIFKCGVGVDNVPFEAAKARGIEVCLPSKATAEHIFEETANFACNLMFTQAYANLGEVDAWTKRQRKALSTHTLLVIGAGNIGGRVVRKMENFMHVLTFDTSTQTEAELQGLMAQADMVTLHIPLTDTTRNFLNAQRLAWLPDGASVINTARGPVVCEDSLYAEIESGRLRAAFDVFWQEPYNGKLKQLQHRGFNMTPHVASTCQNFVQGCADDCKAFIKGLQS